VTTPGAPVNKNLGISIAGLILFWPVGLFALIKSLKVDGLVAAGDYAGAQANADGAKKLGKIAVIIGIVVYVGICAITLLASVLAAGAGSM
jgi:hypothetical protein